MSKRPHKSTGQSTIKTTIKSANRPSDKYPESTQDEMKICGPHAAEAFFVKRAKDLIRLYLTEENLKRFAPIVRYCVDNRLAYKVVDEDEMVRISRSEHHGGVCLLVKAPRPLSFKTLLEKIEQNKKICVVALEGVKNPHNIGAIMRVCAHFGVEALIVQDLKLAQTTAAYRSSQGGAEWVDIVAPRHFYEGLEEIKKRGAVLVATSGRSKGSLYEAKLPPKMVLCMGAEEVGLSERLLKLATHSLHIPGTGHVESLNVSCATSLFLGEYWKNHLQKTS